jgi:hypothetical protein
MTALAMDCDAMRRCQAHDKTNDREAYEMRESFNISDPHCCVTVDLADRATAFRDRSRRAPITCNPRITRTFGAIALALALVGGVSFRALAADPPDPVQDKAWGNCSLNSATVEAIRSAVAAGPGIQNTTTKPVKVSFIVVYSLAYDNDGQPLSGPSAFTGPVICRSSEVGITALDNTGAALKETTDIPTQTDPGPVKATSIDILEAEEAFTLQYTLNNGSNAGKIEKRMCLTIEGNVDCFRIFPAGP